MTEAELKRAAEIGESVRTIKHALNYWRGHDYISVSMRGVDCVLRMRRFLESELARLKEEAEKL